MSIQIVPVEDRKTLTQFIRFPYQIYRDDPYWVAPLEWERRQFFSPNKNPFFKTGEARLFLAKQNGPVVGRISAHIHHRHLERYQDRAGFFGFFECVHDTEVAKGLAEAAQDWLQKRGMKTMRGPFNFTINDEMGILIDGFESRPFLMMTHNPSYYSSLLEELGFQKLKDVYAWHYDVGKVPEQALQLALATKEYPGLSIRPLDRKRFPEEVHLMMTIFNEAWVHNWGFVPMSEEEIRYITHQLRPIIDPEMAFFVFVGNDPAGFNICLPNLNEAIVDLKGRLFPFGWAKLLWRLKRGLSSARVCLMGIRKPYRGGSLGALSVLMNCEMQQRGKLRGYKTAELSWTLEDNERINKGIEFMGGRRYKTYRVYEKQI